MKILNKYASMSTQQIWEHVREEYEDEKFKGYNPRLWAYYVAASQNIRYFPNQGLFRYYNPETGVWDAISKDELVEFILRVYHQNMNETMKSQDLTYTIQILKGCACAVLPESSKEPVIHLGNGMLHIPEEGEPVLKSFSAEYFSLKQSPINYDPEAKCPRFMNELLRPALDEESILCLQKYVGLCLLGRNLIQQMLVLCGTAGGGKGTIVKVIQGLIGKINCAEIRTGQLAGRFETSFFIGKSLLYGADVLGDFFSNKGASHVKSLIGGDALIAEIKNGGVVQLEGSFNLIVTCNAFPRMCFNGDALAWKRRLIVLDFTNDPTSKPIPNLDEILLREEGSGILNFAIQGLQMLMRDIEQAGKMLLPDRIKQRIETLINEGESVKLFVQECIVVCKGSQFTKDEAANAYYRFCKSKGFRPLIRKYLDNSLEAQIDNIHHKNASHSVKDDGKDCKGWRGLAIVRVE